MEWNVGNLQTATLDRMGSPAKVRTAKVISQMSFPVQTLLPPLRQLLVCANAHKDHQARIFCYNIPH